MISAWQSLTVSPLRLSSSPLTQRFPDRKAKERHTQCQTTRSRNASRFCSDLVLLQLSDSDSARPVGTRIHTTPSALWGKTAPTAQNEASASAPRPPITVATGRMLKVGGRTGSQADDRPQALPSPHHDGGQDLATQEAVLDPCGQGVEPLVTQHGNLVMQRAATHWELERGTKTRQEIRRFQISLHYMRKQ